MQTLYTRRKNSDLPAGPYAEFFHKGGCMAYMAKKVPNIQRIINNDILKIVNIVFSGAGGGGGGGAVAHIPPCSPVVNRPWTTSKSSVGF
jgi:hypothetical protein